MDLTKLTKVVQYTVTDNGIICYDKDGNIPNPKTAYWDGGLFLLPYSIKSLKGLPSVVNGYLWLDNYKGESLEGLPDVVNGVLRLDSYTGNDFNHLPKGYEKICIKGKYHTKAEFDNWWKTEKLKKALLD